MDGLLIIDKPAGLSSHDVVNRARRLLGTKRIGHTGTLDPFATGVLVLLIGQATRLAQFVNADEKEYLAVARCGFATDTGDLSGSRLEPRPGDRPVTASGFTPEELEQAIAPLRGEITQVPPMYSAKKVGGEKLYQKARRGEEVERKAVGIRIREFAVVPAFTASEIVAPPGTWDFGFRVICTAGTYIRTLAEAVGVNLHTGAHLVALRRTRAGRFGIDHAITLEQLATAVERDSADAILLPHSAVLYGMPALHLDPADSRRTAHGMPVIGGESNLRVESGAHVALFDEAGKLLGVGEYDANSGMVKPRVMLATGE